MAQLSATELARRLSSVLNRVAAGEEIEIVRNGAPVAVIGPPRVRLLSAESYRELLASAPRPDDEFADDVRELRRAAGTPDDPWQSS